VPKKVEEDFMGKRLFALLVTMIMFVSLVGCGSKNGTSDAAKEDASQTNEAQEDSDIFIGFSLGNTTEPFFQKMEDGVQEAAAKAGVRTQTSSCEGDVAKQVNQVEDFITNQTDAVILTPIDGTGVVPAVEACNQAGVLMVTADINAEGGDITSFVAANNAQGGELAAEHLAKAIGGKGQVVILDDEKISSVYNRSDAFVVYLEENYPDVEIVKRAMVGYTRDVCMKEIEDDIQTYPDLKGVFAAQGSEAGLGAAKAIEAAGKANEIKVINFDAEPESVQKIIDKGCIIGDVFLDPYEIGSNAMKNAIAAVKGESFEKEMMTRVQLVVESNAAEFIED